jgi:UTP--glucose-1-phosphate uridylyltransferase
MDAPKIRKAVIPAAGLGTRFLPATKSVPKELIPVVDKPGIQYIVEEAIAAGVEEIILVLSKDKEQILKHFTPNAQLNELLKKKNKYELVESLDNISKQVTFKVVYQEQPLGLGHAVLCAKELIGDDWFFVFLPDDLIDHEVPCALQMARSWQTHQNAMVAVMEVPWEQVEHYGVVKALPMTASLGKIEGVVEKPKRDGAPSNLAIIGRYLLPGKIFGLLEKVTPGAIGEIQLTDALLELARAQTMYAFQFEGDRYDVGNKLGFIEATINLAMNDPEIKSAVQDMIKVLV